MAMTDPKALSVPVDWLVKPVLPDQRVQQDRKVPLVVLVQQGRKGRLEGLGQKVRKGPKDQRVRRVSVAHGD